MMSADTKNGLVYVSGDTPSNDFYGGERKGDGLFAESVVCIDAKTGKRVWHFQTVHHGVWDYDIPAAPVLHDIVRSENEPSTVCSWVAPMRTHSSPNPVRMPASIIFSRSASLS